MKRLNRLLAIPGMFLLVMVLLITSFQLVIYGDPSYGFYEKEYEKYHVTASLHMSMEDVMEVTEHMMDYLIGKEEKLSIVTDVDGREQDFFNEQDRLHMADVKNLFLGGLKLRAVFLMLAIVLLMLAGVKAGRKRISRQFFEAYSIPLVCFLVCSCFWELRLPLILLPALLFFTRSFSPMICGFLIRRWII